MKRLMPTLGVTLWDKIRSKEIREECEIEEMVKWRKDRQRFLLHEELVAAGSLGTDWCKCVIEQFTSAYRYTRCVNERKGTA
ncbi:hypothetical protein HUJ05_006178 [Dendroctonus ponderosae]|nr:hypothetical protein HUJ05_006178 [Dendroctonus ponderosae]